VLDPRFCEYRSNMQPLINVIGPKDNARNNPMLKRMTHVGRCVGGGVGLYVRPSHCVPKKHTAKQGRI
jgi:hypothetical protein